MKKQIVLILLGLITVGLLGRQYFQVKDRGDRVDAAGKLSFTFNNLPPTAPVFSINDLKPGDCYTRPVKAQNDGSSPALIAVKSEVIDNVDQLSNTLFLTITQGQNTLYGGGVSKSLTTFFNDTNATIDGLTLSAVPKKAQTTYEFKVCMPPEAGNEWQRDTLVFDLMFGQSVPSTLVINEVIPRSTCYQGNIEAQYAELYNNGNYPIPLKNWRLTDGTKTVDLITPNAYTLEPGKFVILAHDNGLFGKKAKCYVPKEGLMIINLGGRLNLNTGILKLVDPVGNIVDRVDWQKYPVLPINKSYERKTPGFDTVFGDNFVNTDFKTPSLPTPGQ